MRSLPHSVSPLLRSPPGGRSRSRRADSIIPLTGAEVIDVLARSPCIDVDGIMAEWARRELRPRMLLSEDLAVIWADPRINLCSVADYGLSMRGGRLFGTSARSRQLLSEFVAMLGNDLSVATFPATNSSQLSLIVRGRIVEHHGRSMIGLEVEGTNDNPNYAYVGVRAAFGLTTAEERVVQTLLDGRSATMLAEELGISLDTARTHIRQVYAKVGVNCREALFHRLRAYRVG